MQDSVELGRGIQRILWSKSLDSHGFGFEFAVSYVLFLRAERSLAAIRLLVREGLTDDAMALVRVMVEKVINAEYILLGGAEPAMDFIQFGAFDDWRTYQEISERHPSLAPQYKKQVSKDLKRMHDEARIKILPDGSAKNRYGRGHDWIELSLLKRSQKVDALLKERRLPAKTCMMFDGSYKRSAQYLHGSFASIVRSIDAGRDKGKPLIDSGKVEVEVGIRLRDNSPKLGVDALATANAVAFQMLAFLADVLSQQKSKQWVMAFAKKNVARSSSGSRSITSC